MITNRGILVFTTIVFLLMTNHYSQATTYFVDASNGNDDYAGTSAALAWQSISKVNSSVFLPGDSIFFKRNESWREQLIVSSSGVEGNPITYGAYGEGDAPLFLGSVAKNSASDWNQLGQNKWATAVGSFPKIQWRSVGFLLMGEESQENVGSWVEYESDLDEEGEFWWEEATERVILYAPQGNPALVYGRVEIAHLHSCFLLKNKEHLVIQDLAFKYSNNAAILPDACHHITIQHIKASYLGGGFGTTTRAGDAIPPHGESSYILIRDCTISQVFDIGIAPQLYPLEEVVMHNIIVENCSIDRCGAGITIAAHGAIASEIHSIYFRNNVVSHSGYGWSGTANSVHGKGMGIKEKHGAIKPDVHDVYIENNVIDTYAFRGINAYEGHFHIRGNIIKNGRADYIEGNIGYPGAIALAGGDFETGDSNGEATGIIAYNLIYDNDCHGIFIKHNTPYPSEPLEIYNNVLYNNGDATYASIRSRTSSGSILKNNIIYAENQSFIEAGPFGDGTTELSNNLYYNPSVGIWVWDEVTYSDLGNYQLASTQDSASVFGEPEFNDLNSYDFHLQPTSPAIDAGTDVGLSHDYDSIPVPLGMAPDMGAFEYDFSIRINQINQATKANILVYPNPSHGKCTIKIEHNKLFASTEYQLNIFTLSGVLVEKIKTRDYEFIWNNASIPAGLYILQLDGVNKVTEQCLLFIQ